MDAIRIDRDDPAAPDVVALLERHLAFARGCTPVQDAHALDVEALRDQAIAFFSAREGDLVLGVGALKRIEPGHYEVKSMHTAESARGRGVGRAILTRLLEFAEAQGAARVSLETGSMDEFEAARTLYRSAGFADCQPFADYVESPNSVYMTRPMERGAAG